MSQGGALEYRTFAARCTDEGPDPATRAWMTARYNGFLQVVPPARELAALAAAWQDEGRVLHAIYDLGPQPDAALGHDVPVATTAVIEANLDAGGEAGIPCRLIADVTVRATHRSQGLMRRLLQSVATQAGDDGVPLLALHAAHPALYARFGFSPAIRSLSVEADCARFALRSEPAGSVHEADPRHADELARTVAASAGVRFGALDVSAPAQHGPPDGDQAVRCLVHVDDRGHVDGVLTYAFLGWTPQAQVLEVRSETYSTGEAHAALWRTICTTGVASTVRAYDVRTDDALPWMLVDRAAWRVTGASDGFSLRVLDPATAMRMRGYTGPDAELTIEVTDPAGPAAGTWLVRVSGGRAVVDPTAEPADITLDARELAASFLATTSATTLLEAGLLAGSRESAEVMDQLLRWPVDASSALHF